MLFIDFVLFIPFKSSIHHRDNPRSTSVVQHHAQIASSNWLRDILPLKSVNNAMLPVKIIIQRKWLATRNYRYF